MLIMELSVKEWNGTDTLIRAAFLFEMLRS